MAYKKKGSKSKRFNTRAKEKIAADKKQKLKQRIMKYWINFMSLLLHQKVNGLKTMESLIYRSIAQKSQVSR